MIVDHFGFGVSDYGRAKAFYAQALAPLGITLVMEFTPEQTEGRVWACGFGRGGKPEFWIGSDGKTTPVMHRCPGRLPRSGAPGRRPGQRCAGAAAAVPPALLRRLRAGPRRPQRRGGLPPARPE